MRDKGDGLFELLKNEDFVLWVVNPREETTHYWSKWLAAHPERQRDVELARKFILAAEMKQADKMPANDYDQVLNKIVEHSRARRITRPWRAFWNPLIAAASMAILISSAFLIRQWVRKEENVIQPVIKMIHKEAPSGSKITTRLPDGSVVILNSESKIAFPDPFQGDIREVELIGEAFFQIQHHPDQPFQVKFNQDVVKVLGTSFNIRTYQNESTSSVSVATGQVSFSSGDSHIVLNPNEMVVHDHQDEAFVKKKVDPLASFGWKDKILYFHHATFNHVLDELERWYGVEIVTTSDFSSRGTYSGEFNNPTLDQVLQSISFVYRFRFTIEGKKITLFKI